MSTIFLRRMIRCDKCILVNFKNSNSSDLFAFFELNDRKSGEENVTRTEGEKRGDVYQ